MFSKMKILVTLLAMLTIAFAQDPQVRRFSNAEFQQQISRKLPENKLISGSNKRRGMDTVARAKNYVSKNGCNTNVCFALDAGVFVSQEEYTLQQDFTALIAAIAGIDQRFYVAGAQYGLRMKPFTTLTSDVDQFLIDVNATSTRGEWTKAQRRRRPFWRFRSRFSFKRTLKFCTRQLKDGARSADKIVFLGDLRSPRGGAVVARRFLPPRGNGAICAVGFGNGSRVKLEKFTGNPDAVVGPEQFEEVLDILEELVKVVCGPETQARAANSVFKDSATA